MGKTIVSWSPVAGQGATTSNTVGLASVMALENAHRSLLATTQLTTNAAGLSRKSKASVFDDSGIDGLERLIKSKLLKPNDIQVYTDTIYKSSLDYLPGRMSGREKDEVLNVILHIAKEQYDFIWIDAESGITSSQTQDLLTKADLILISLPQNSHVIENFMANIPKQLQDKPYFILVSQYDEKASYSLRNIKRQNRVAAPLFAIPYATAYRDAMNQNSVAEFFIRAMTVEKRDSLYSFIQSLKTINSAIVKQLGYTNVLEDGDW